MDTRTSGRSDDPPGLPAKQMRELCLAAYKGRPRGWSPYSKFAVAAAVLTKDGKVYAGPGNVECANYSLTKHAEETAVLVALAGGALERCGRTFLRAVYIATAGLPDKPTGICPPCGGCRQFLWEFADEQTLVIMERPGGGEDVERLACMLPRAFGPATLEIEDSDNPRGPLVDERRRARGKPPRA